MIMNTNSRRLIFFSLVWIALALVLPDPTFAHCDGLDGPVVKAARKALDSGNLNPVLSWVQKSDEAEIKKVFQKTLAVRKLDPQAKELADAYFFETLVRIHRAGEGASYAGLKPAGRDLGPAIPAADKAIEGGSAKALTKILTEAVQGGVADRFKEVTAKKKFKSDDVETGRQYIKAYVEFVHYIERIYEAAKNASEGHYPEPQGTAGHKD
jgi:Family of unknown function (DUF6448)